MSDADPSAGIRRHAEHAAGKAVVEKPVKKMKNTFHSTNRLHSVRLANIRKSEMRSLVGQIRRLMDEPRANSVCLALLKSELDECFSYIVKGATRVRLESLQEEIPK